MSRNTTLVPSLELRIGPAWEAGISAGMRRERVPPHRRKKLYPMWQREPVGCNGGEVEDEIVIDELFGMFSESLLLLKRSYCTAACDRLTEMYVDRWTSRRLESLQLPRRRYVEPLDTVSYLPLTASELYNVAYKQVLCSSRLILHSASPRNLLSWRTDPSICLVIYNRASPVSYWPLTASELYYALYTNNVFSERHGKNTVQMIQY